MDNELFNEYSPLPGSLLFDALAKQDAQQLGLAEVETAASKLQEQHAAANMVLAGLAWNSTLDSGRTAAAELPLLERLLNAAASELHRRRDEKRLHDKVVHGLASELREAQNSVNTWSRAWRITQAMLESDGRGVSQAQIENDQAKFNEATANLARVRSRLLGC